MWNTTALAITVQKLLALKAIEASDSLNLILMREFWKRIENFGKENGGGGGWEFLLTNLTVNMKLEDRDFYFYSLFLAESSISFYLCHRINPRSALIECMT